MTDLDSFLNKLHALGIATDPKRDEFQDNSYSSLKLRFPDGQTFQISPIHSFEEGLDLRLEEVKGESR